jgi:peroxiredoxin (alkyl hydroperoxide reductase subunit C)
MDAASGGIKGVTYPLVSDSSKVISKMYGVLAGDYQVDAHGGLTATGPMIAYRGLFFIDMKGIVQFQLVNNFLLVRSVSEVLRMVDAHLSFLENGEICRPE